MTKSKMRVYGGNRYSDHEAELRMTIDQNDIAYLHVDYLFKKTWVEHIRIPADDVIMALAPRVFELIDDATDEAFEELDEVLNEE